MLLRGQEEFDQLAAEREAVARALVDQEAQLQALLQEHANTAETLNRTLQEVDQHRAETHAHENRLQQATPVARLGLGTVALYLGAC